jgi:hypothetical protein
VVFVKVLLHYLKKLLSIPDDSGAFMYQQTKTLAATCVSCSQASDPNFSLLQPILESLLHELVGE